MVFSRGHRHPTTWTIKDSTKLSMVHSQWPNETKEVNTKQSWELLLLADERKEKRHGPELLQITIPWLFLESICGGRVPTLEKWRGKSHPLRRTIFLGSIEDLEHTNHATLNHPPWGTLKFQGNLQQSLFSGQSNSSQRLLPFQICEFC